MSKQTTLGMTPGDGSNARSDQKLTFVVVGVDGTSWVVAAPLLLILA